MPFHSYINVYLLSSLEIIKHKILLFNTLNEVEFSKMYSNG